MVLSDVRAVILGYFNPSGSYDLDGNLISACQVNRDNLLLEDGTTHAIYECQFEYTGSTTPLPELASSF